MLYKLMIKTPQSIIKNYCLAKYYSLIDIQDVINIRC